jgi:Na+/melibiose symporter-like transporter
VKAESLTKNANPSIVPIGACTIAVIYFCLRIPYSKPVQKRPGSYDQYFKEFDVAGAVLLIAAVVCLLLALQQGTTHMSWSQGSTIALLVLFGVFGIGFGVVEWAAGSHATLPRHLVTQRSLLAASIFGMCLAGAFALAVYFLPLFYQMTEGQSATDSAISILALIVASIVATVGTGVLLKIYGYCNPILILSAVLMSVGAGFLTTLVTEDGTVLASPSQIGFQILFGTGVGLGLQVPLMVAQTFLPDADIPMGTAMVAFTQALGSTLFLGVGQTVFTKALSNGLRDLGLPSESTRVILAGGGTIDETSEAFALLPAIALKQGQAIAQAFFVAVGLAIVTAVSALLVEWKKVKTDDNDTSSTKSGGSSSMELDSV